MPSLPWSARRDVSLIEDTSLAALLAGQELPADADERLRPVADVLEALKADPGRDELVGLAEARAEFRRHVGGPEKPQPSRWQTPGRQRPEGVARRLGAGAAAAAAIIVVSFGGAAAATYFGALPGSLQQFAHRMIGAPAAHQPVPDVPHGAAARKAAYGLCTAYQRSLAHGSAAQKAAAFRRLARAAGGAGHVTAWCATFPHAKSPHSARHKAPHPSQKPGGRRAARGDQGDGDQGNGDQGNGD